MTDEELRQLEALRAASTPGRWYVPQGDGYETSVDAVYHSGEEDNVAEALGETQTARRNAVLIVAEHNAVPLLIAEVRRLREENARQDDDICAWKTAAGLNRGGDPDRIKHEDLARYIQLLTRVVYAARGTVPAYNDQGICERSLWEALADLDKEFLEET